MPWQFCSVFGGSVPLAFGLLWAFTASAAPLLEPLPYRIDSWSPDDGLPQGSVNSIVQARNGFLWVGTFGGLARFDGVNFKVFDTENTPSLPSPRVLSLFEDHLQALWLGTEDGTLTRCADGRLQTFAPPNLGGISKYIRSFAETADGTLWLLSSEGLLLRFADGAFTVPCTNWSLEGNSARAIAADAFGQLWVGTEKELATWQDGRFVSRWGQAQEPDFDVDGLAPGGAGGMWVAGHGRLRQFADGKWQHDGGSYPWTKGVLSDLREDSRGQVWLATYGSGLYRYSTNGKFLNLTRTEGLPGNLVRSLIEDREGNLWVGTEGHGLARIKRAVFLAYGRAQGLSSDLVQTVCEGRDGELWVGLNGEGIDRLERGTVRHYKAQQGLTNECIWTVCQTRDRTLWTGTWGGGLFKLEGDSFVSFDPQGPCGPIVCALFEDSHQVLWLGQNRAAPELTLLQQGRPSVRKLNTRRSNLDVRCFAEDAQGNLWVGTRGDGLYRLTAEQETRFGKREGLTNESVLALHAAANGTLWVGTAAGLFHFRNNAFDVFTTREGLADDSVLSITEDNSGHLWCGSGKGVFRVDNDELELVARGQASTVQCLAYTRADGLPSLECSSGCQPAVCKTRDGRLWFPTVNGLAVVEPETITFNRLPPPVFVDEVVIGPESAKSRSVPAGLERATTKLLPLRVPPGQHRCDFHYTALSLTAPQKVRFRYRLEGLEKTWVDAENERVAHYSFLPPGEYRFRVLACNNDGVWNEHGASLAMLVLPHVWQTWWFRALAVCVCLLLLFAAFEVRLLLERRLTRLRLRIARDLHDEVGSNLGTIALLSEVAAGQAARATEEVTEIRRVAVQTIDSLRDIVWFLDPASDRLDELVLRMQESARAMLRGVAFQFSANGEAGSRRPSLELRRNLLPMFKELLHNIVQHARATRVEIVLELEPRQLRLRVSDNGIGFDERQVRGGNGLRNLRRRAADLEGSVTFVTSPGNGTVVTVTAPIP